MKNTIKTAIHSKTAKRILCLLTAGVLVCSLGGCKKKNTQPTPTEVISINSSELIERTEQDIVREIITLYGSYENAAAAQIEARLTELGEIDPGKEELWREIMEYWTYANNDLPINANSLPVNLSRKDNLCIVVLGFELNPDGSMQDELIGRLKVALECAKQYPYAYVCCTGGGTAADNPDVTEADLMGEWLIKQGLEEERLIIENQSMTTAENARNSYNIFLKDYPQINAVAIVSSSYHIAWGSLLFEASFLKTAEEQGTPKVHVVSNAAFPTENEYYSDTVRFETGGMLQLIGEDNLALQYYRGTFTKPDLN